MKFVRQFMIILAISFVGELLHALLPLPVPASIYGLVLMLIGLQTGILPLNAVNEAGGFLIESCQCFLSLPESDLWFPGVL